MKFFIRTLYGKISIIFLLLVIIFGTIEVIVSVKSSINYVCEASQKLNYSLAQNIEDVCKPFLKDSVTHSSIRENMAHLRMINPHLDVYFLDEQGHILTYYNGSRPIYRNPINIIPIQRYIQENSYDLLPIFGDDPISSNRHKVFSAAKMSYGDDLKPGYVYVTIASARYELASEGILDSYILSTSAIVLIIILLFTAGTGLVLFFLMTKRLHRMTGIVHKFKQGKYKQRIPIKSEDEVGELAIAFNNMADTIEKNLMDLKKNDDLRRELIANISHDLRSPLSSIQGYIETILMKEKNLSNDDRKNYLETILKNVINLNRLVHELFELSKLDAMETKPVLESFSITELTQDVVLKFKPKAEEKKIDLISKIPLKIPFVYADIGMIERVLSNLIDNALRYTSEKGKIKIDIRTEDSDVIVSVADSGKGIPPKELPYIFDRFYKVDKSRAPSNSGSGLGLAIAKKMINAHDSDILVKSDIDSGTEFSFSLKQYQQDDDKNKESI
ncbi:MAG: HAMP domain-containing sensor histidine kinase [Calditrichaceae bacterium]